MRFGNRVAVIGAAARVPAHDPEKSLEEQLYAIVRDALADAEISIGDIEGIVVAANDQYDGRAITVMAASGSVGGVGRDILSTPSASEHAFVMGALRVASGQQRTQLVVTWSPTEVGNLSEAQRLAADPYFHRRLPLDELASHALQAGALEADVRGARDLARAVAAKNRRNGAQYADASERRAKPPWPLESGVVAEPAPGLAAMVLAREDLAGERDGVAWLQGIGWATEPSFLGDRDLSQAPALAAAAARAYEQAGIRRPLAEFDVAEVSDAVPHHELIAYEGLGLSDRTRWEKDVAEGTFARTGPLPVNLSGGVAAINPVYAVGFLRILEAAQQVRGRAGGHQKAGVRRAVAHAASGFAMQYQTVAVLGREPGGAA